MLDKFIPDGRSIGSVAITLLVVLTVLTMPVMAAVPSFLNGDYNEQYTTDFTSALDGSEVEFRGEYSYNNLDNVYTISGGGSGVMEYVNGTPSTDSWAVRYDAGTAGTSSAAALQFYAGDVTNGSTSTPDGYEVVFDKNTNEIRIVDDGTVVNSTSTSTDIWGAVRTVEYQDGTVTVYVDGTEQTSYTIDNPDTSGDGLALRAETDTGHAIQGFSVYESITSDSDNDGIKDANDPYPDHAEQTYTVDRNTTKTPDTVYAEYTINGTADVTVQAYNNSSAEYETVTETTINITNASSSTPVLQEFNISSYSDGDYTEYQVVSHGLDADSAGVFYADGSDAVASGGTSDNGSSSDSLPVVAVIVGLGLVAVLMFRD